MDCSKCEALLRSVEMGSFSAAAEQLGYTASGVVRMVNALEAEMGFPLLNRGRTGVVLTSDGERLLPALRQFVAAGDRALQLAAEVKGLCVGDLAIGTYYSVAAQWLPPILKEFQEDYPKVRIHTLEGGNSDLLAWLEEGRADCCFFSETSWPGDWIPLKQDELVAWLPPDHPRAGDKAFPIKELDGAPFIKTFPGCDTDIERLFAREGLCPDIRFTTANDFTTYAMVEAGLGMGLDNRMISRKWSGRVVELPFDPPQYITLGVAVPSIQRASPATKKFISYARRMVGEMA